MSSIGLVINGFSKENDQYPTSLTEIRSAIEAYQREGITDVYVVGADAADLSTISGIAIHPYASSKDGLNGLGQGMAGIYRNGVIPLTLIGQQEAGGILDAQVKLADGLMPQTTFISYLSFLKDNQLVLVSDGHLMMGMQTLASLGLSADLDPTTRAAFITAYFSSAVPELGKPDGIISTLERKQYAMQQTRLPGSEVPSQTAIPVSLLGKKEAAPFKPGIISAPDPQTLKRLSRALPDGRWALVDNGAPWCGPCKEAEPFVEKVATALGGHYLVISAMRTEKTEAEKTLGKWTQSIDFNLWADYNQDRAFPAFFWINNKGDQIPVPGEEMFNPAANPLNSLLEATAQLTDDERIAAYQQQLNTSDPTAQFCAIERLLEIGDKNDATYRQVVEILVGLLFEDQFQNVHEIIEELLNRSGSEGLMVVLIALLAHPSDKIRRSAAHMASLTKSDLLADDIEALVKTVTSDSNVQVQFEALSALVTHRISDAPRVVPVLKSWLSESQHQEMQSKALTIVKILGPSAAALREDVKKMTAATPYYDDTLRARALLAMASIDGQKTIQSDTLAIARTALSESTGDAQYVGVSIVASAGDTSDIPALETIVNDPTSTSRIVAFIALSVVEPKADFLKRVEVFLKDLNPEMRLIAFASYCKIKKMEMQWEVKEGIWTLSLHTGKGNEKRTIKFNRIEWAQLMATREMEVAYHLEKIIKVLQSNK